MLYWVFGYREDEANYLSWTECDTTDKETAIDHLYKVLDEAETISTTDGKTFEVLDLIEDADTLEYIVMDGYGKPYHYGVGCDR